LQQANNNKTSPYRHYQFCEMWLAETCGGGDGVPEARKIGLFAQYDTITGELVQVFRMREAALPTTRDPAERISMDALEDSVDTKIWNSQQHLQSEAAKAFFAGKRLDVETALTIGGYTAVHTRAVQQTSENDGSEVTCCLVKEAPTKVLNYYSPARHDLYHKCRFDDGVYACIPVRLDPDMNEIGFELGCFTVDGDFHRMLAVGSRDQVGGLRTIVYERWSKDKESSTGSRGTRYVVQP
jgi:hypothetical protein